MQTPWGQTQHTKEYVKDGIVFHHTASHGGFKVYSKYNKRIPEYMREKNGWYEEDCDWSKVVVSMPEYFDVEVYRQAEETLRNWFPDSYEKMFNCKLQPENSYVLRERKFREETIDKYVVVSAMNWNDRFVKCMAIRGGRLENGRYASKDEKWYLIPQDEYTGNFVIDESRHTETDPGFGRPASG